MKKILVTGANKGIGLEVCRQLLNKGGCQVLLASRDLDRGRQALDSLDLGADSKNASLISLDVTNSDSIQQCSEKIQSDYGSIDVLINNAGVASRSTEVTYQVGKPLFDANFYGAKNTTEALLPMISERVINVSSSAGRLGILGSQDTKLELLDCVSVEDLEEILDEFMIDLITNQSIKEKWSANLYGMSKVFMSMWSRIMAMETEPLWWAACCPGYTNTDMTSGRGRRTVEQGAYVVTELATMDVSGQESGAFWMAHFEEKLRDLPKGTDFRDVVTVDIIPWLRVNLQ